MTKIRNIENGNYTVLGNSFLRDKELSLKAKGLLAVCFSLPEGWKYNIRGLASICKENKDTIAAIMRELIDAGYVDRKQVKNRDHGFGYEDYIFRDTSDKGSPADSPCPDNAVSAVVVTDSVTTDSVVPAFSSKSAAITGDRISAATDTAY